MRVTVLGYVCRDRNVLPNGQTTDVTGGKGLFLAAALARSGIETDLITWLPPADAGLLKSLAEYPVTIHVIPIPTGTVNRNEHRGDETVAYTTLDPKTITIDDLNEAMLESITDSDVVILAPDIQEKISLDLIRYLANDLGVKLAADIGKYYRQLNPEGVLQPRWPWPDQANYLRYFETIILSIEDVAGALAHGESELSLARLLSEQGPAEVIITQGGRGALIFSADTNEAVEAPVFPPRTVVDTTGAGDTFFGAYLAKRLLSDNIFEASRYAAMAASLKLNYSGPLRETAEQIEQAVIEQTQPSE